MIGRFEGQWWVKKRHGSVFPASTIPNSFWYFLLDDERRVTGDHFRTLAELEDFVLEALKRSAVQS